MADNVVSCPHCSKPVVVPSVDEEKITQIVSSALNSSSFCQRFPELCGQVSSLQRQVKGITEVMASHPKPDERLINIWENCPECRPELDRLVKSGAFNKGQHPVLSEELLKQWASCPECRIEAEKLGIELPKVGQESEAFPWVQKED